MVNIVYHSTTGNVERFLFKVKAHAIDMGLNINLVKINSFIPQQFKENFHLFTPTRGSGQIPDLIDSFLYLNKDQQILSVSGSGNRNWGHNFCGAVDKIKEKFSIPVLIKIELSGTSREAVTYVEELKTFHSIKNE